MKYISEYKETTNKKEFITLVLQRNPTHKQKTIDRRYYELRKEFGSTKKPKYNKDDKTPVDQFKLLLIHDMKRYKIKITREMLKIYGFYTSEINWLVDEGYINI